jgi:hypothetical protein
LTADTDEAGEVRVGHDLMAKINNGMVYPEENEQNEKKNIDEALGDKSLATF